MKVLLILALALSLLLLGIDGRRFKDEQTNKALKNTRRVQQSYGSARQIYWDFDKHFWRLDLQPPVLEVGVEFEQTQPIINTMRPVGGDAGGAYTSAIQMQAWKLRAKLRGRGGVKLNSKFNIDKLFYNDFTFELDEIIAFLFGDIFVIYKLADVALT